LSRIGHLHINVGIWPETSCRSTSTDWTVSRSTAID